MKKTILRRAALLLVLLLVSGLFAGCGVKPEDGRVVLRLDDERIYYDAGE